MIKIIKNKIKDNNIIWLIRRILKNYKCKYKNKGMPIGNLTSQFFANVYLNELDYFIKHKLKTKYYIRYVDDFIILYNSKKQLKKWKEEIDKFLKKRLDLELHEGKSKILELSNGISFLGLRIFFYHKLLRKNNIDNFRRKFNQLKTLYKERIITKEKVIGSLGGWLSYTSHANTYKYGKGLINELNKLLINGKA